MINKYKIKLITADNLLSSFINKYIVRNIMIVPKLLKIVINIRLGCINNNNKLLNDIITDFNNILLQKPLLIRCNKSISSFNIRINQINSLKYTLRNIKMYNFLNKLINLYIYKYNIILSINSIDQYGNLSIGLNNHLIFKDNNFNFKTIKPIGFDINLVINKNTINDSYKLLKLIGFKFI